MAGAIVAFTEPTNLPPRCRVQITGAAGTQVTVTRYNNDGTSYVLRSANPAPLVAGALTVYDYESPFNYGGTYSYTTNTGETSTCTVAQLRGFYVQDPWLIHPGIPALSQRLSYVNVGTRTRTITTGVHQVLGRATPIVNTDGTRHADTVELTCRTTGQADEDALAALLADGTTLLFQDVQVFTTRIHYWWVSVGDVTIEEVTDNFDDQILKWTLPLTLTDPPAGDLQSQRTYADVLAQAVSYSRIAAMFTTYNDLLINNPH